MNLVYEFHTISVTFTVFGFVLFDIFTSYICTSNNNEEESAKESGNFIRNKVIEYKIRVGG